MMEFYQTEAGRIFFNVQLPSLIQALEDVAKALNQKQMPVSLPEDAESDFLKELYYGTTCIGAASMENYSNEKLTEVTVLQDDLKKQLTEEQWELFQQCCSKAACNAADEACRMFQHGFGLAVKLIMAGIRVGK